MESICSDHLTGLAFFVRLPKTQILLKGSMGPLP